MNSNEEQVPKAESDEYLQDEPHIDAIAILEVLDRTGQPTEGQCHFDLPCYLLIFFQRFKLYPERRSALAEMHQNGCSSI